MLTKSFVKNKQSESLKAKEKLNVDLKLIIKSDKAKIEV